MTKTSKTTKVNWDGVQLIEEVFGWIPKWKTRHQAAQILRTTADAIKKYGFIKHSAGNPHDGFCVLGAKEYACRHMKVSPLAERRVTKLLERVVSINTGYDIVTFNDSTSTRKGGVLRLLNTAADMLE